MNREGSPARLRGRCGTRDPPYFTAYAGLRSVDGDLIGMLYVGLPLDAMPG